MKTLPPKTRSSFAPDYRQLRFLRLRAGGLQRLATSRRPAADRHAARCASRNLCSGGTPRRYTPSSERRLSPYLSPVRERDFRDDREKEQLTERIRV